MSSPGGNVVGNVAAMSQLADMQSRHRRQFDDILADIEAATAKALETPEGAAREENDADGENFEDHCQRARAAFDKMIATTGERAASVGGRRVNRLPKLSIPQLLPSATKGRWRGNSSGDNATPH